VKFEPRRVEDIRYEYPKEAFEKVRKLSEFNEAIYRAFASPWVRAAASTPMAAELHKWLHPMRMSRYVYSERINPWMAWVKVLAQAAMEARTQVARDSPYLAAENAASLSISQALDSYRIARDQACETLFAAMFGSGVGSKRHGGSSQPVR